MEMSEPQPLPAPAQESKPKRNPWLYGSLGCCLAAVIAGVCLCIAFTGTAMALIAIIFGRESPDLGVQYDLPNSVAVGDEFDLTLTLTNTSDQPLEVNDIDLDSAFSASILDGITVLSTDPDMERDYTIPGIKTFHYNSTLPPHTPATVTFHLLAHTPGEFSGTVFVYTGLKSDIINPFIVITEK